MSDIIWTLDYLGTEKTLAAWGISDARLGYVTQGADTLQFKRVVQECHVDPEFAYGGTVKLYRTEGAKVCWFVGRLGQTPQQASAGSEAVDYTAKGPWWWLENGVFEQVWQSYSGDPLNPLIPIYSSRLVLGQKTDGNQQTVKEQVVEIIQSGMTNGAPMLVDDSGMPDTQTPFMEVREKTYAECVRDMLRWVPDAVTWFDYTTADPTFRCGRRPALAAVTLSVEGSPCEGFQVTPMKDIQRAAVYITYERMIQVNGTAYTEQVIDKAPPSATGREFRGLRANIQLGTTVQTSLQAELVTAPVLVNDLAWWQDRSPELVNYSQVQVVSATRTQPGYANELIEGPVPDWTGVTLVDDTATLEVRCIKSDGTREVKKIHHRMKVTNATGTFTKTTFPSIADPAPAGLALDLYTALNLLQYAGSITLRNQECSMVARPGQVLNLTGGHVDWTTMTAVVSQVDYDIEAGRTVVNFGPPTHLGPQDLVALLMTTRVLNRFTMTSTRVSGTPTGGAVGVSGKVPQADTSAGTKSFEALAVKTGNGSVVMDPSIPIAQGKPLTIREVAVCERAANGTSVQKKMLIVGSAPY